MKWLYITAAIVGVAVLSVATYVVVDSLMEEENSQDNGQGSMEAEVRKDGEPDFSVEPKGPNFNDGDNSECREKVTYYYERAYRNF